MHNYNFSCFLFQFGKGVLEMARVFDRQVGMCFLPNKVICSVFRFPKHPIKTLEDIHLLVLFF